jgi:hypothetical protein
MPREFIQVQIMRTRQTQNVGLGFTNTELLVGTFLCRLYRQGNGQKQNALDQKEPGRSVINQGLVLAIKSGGGVVMEGDIVNIPETVETQYPRRAKILRVRRYDQNVQCDIEIGKDDDPTTYVGGILPPLPATNPGLTGVASLPIGAGMAVNTNIGGQLRLALADHPNTAGVLGLVKEATNAGFIATLETDSLTLADWTAATGFPMLSIGARYFLSTTEPGKLVTLPTEQVGQCVTYVGIALDSDTMAIEIDQPILL